MGVPAVWRMEEAILQMVTLRGPFATICERWKSLHDAVHEALPRVKP
jgi:hypothetical protein